MYEPTLATYHTLLVLNNFLLQEQLPKRPFIGTQHMKIESLQGSHVLRLAMTAAVEPNLGAEPARTPREVLVMVVLNIYHVRGY